jgi:hypothetical protein
VKSRLWGVCTERRRGAHCSAEIRPAEDLDSLSDSYVPDSVFTVEIPDERGDKVAKGYVMSSTRAWNLG